MNIFIRYMYMMAQAFSLKRVIITMTYPSSRMAGIDSFSTVILFDPLDRIRLTLEYLQYSIQVLLYVSKYL